MPLKVNYPFSVDEYSAYCSSLGATPLAAFVHVAEGGQLIEVGVVQSAAVTGTSTVTVSVGGVTVATIPVTGGGIGSVFTAVPSASTYVNEDDVVLFAPAGGTGAAITGMCFAKVRGS
jgi:hypothetical protein